MSDGELVIAIQSEQEWQTFCTEVLGNEQRAKDHRFSVNVRRIANRDALDEHIQQVLGHRSLVDVQAALDRARIAYGRISSLSDLVRNGKALTLPVETPKGNVELLAPPTLIDGQRASLGRVPALGEHDEGLRAEFAVLPTISG